MIPQAAINPEVFSELKIVSQPSKTFGINFESGRVTGIIDNDEAIRQAVYSILNTERYKYLIHSHSYGVETEDLYGEVRERVIMQLPKRITEALLQDDRIENVSGFEITPEGKNYVIHFEVTATTGQNINYTYKAVI